MSIQNFPAALQPIIQQGFLEREFEDGLKSTLAYRSIADRVDIAVGVGETVTKTRPGLKSTVTTPLAASTNTNLDNGLTPKSTTVEQYTLRIDNYADTMDLNMVTSRVGIASQFVLNARLNAEQAARSMDEIARNVLFGGYNNLGGYLGGNTRVRTTLGSPNPVVAVDDIRGFQSAPQFPSGMSAAQALAAGAFSPTMNPVSASNTLAVTVGSNVYTLVAVAADGSNVSTAPGGVSGTLTFSGNVTVADGTAGNAAVTAIAPSIIRPNGRATTAALQATDLLTMSNLLDAVAQLRLNAVPEIDGAYNCFLDPKSARQLFADPDFKQLFMGAKDASQVFKKGMVNDLLGLRFIPTTEALVQAAPGVANAYVRRPIICGKGALIEGAFDGMAASDVAPENSIISQVDGVVMVTREPIDRLQQIIAQSWYWIGGYTTPTDVTTNPNTVATATNAALKRAVIIEHIG